MKMLEIAEMITDINIYQFHEDNYVSLQDYNKLQYNWNSLRELIEQRIYLIEPKGTCINFYCEYDSEDDYVQGMKEQARLNTLKFILDKMNELEGKEND